MQSIRPYLIVGPGILASDVPRLRRAGVTAVLSLQEPDVDLRLSAMEQVRRACQPSMEFHNVAVQDYDPQAVIRALPQALAILHHLVRSGRVVYLHCSEGINRSPSIALAYLVQHERLSLGEAVAELLRCHPSARPYQSLRDWLAASHDNNR